MVYLYGTVSMQCPSTVKLSRDLWAISYHQCTKNEFFHSRFLRQMWPNPQETTDLVTFTEWKISFFVQCPPPIFRNILKGWWNPSYTFKTDLERFGLYLSQLVLKIFLIWNILFFCKQSRCLMFCKFNS